jgi:hypothetical protein
MDNLVLLHTRHALDPLGVLIELLRLLRLLGNHLLQVLHLILQLCSLSLTHLELLVSLMQLGPEVVDVALGGGHLILSMLQSDAGVVKEVGLDVMAAISPHQLVIQFLDTRLKVGVLLEKLLVALLDVLDDSVLGLHLASVLLQAEAQVSARQRDLLK